MLGILSKLTENDATKFNNGIIIQTNGIYIGAGNVETLKNRLLKNRLFELYNINPDVIIALKPRLKERIRRKLHYWLDLTHRWRKDSR
ncbi:MAG TPA: hypothetical protein VEG44_02830 [Candidatus Acidoferrales bacterium]|nr:hypothetical protein [Candidatus Acidoferrales bacterium]